MGRQKPNSFWSPKARAHVLGEERIEQGRKEEEEEEEEGEGEEDQKSGMFLPWNHGSFDV